MRLVLSILTVVLVISVHAQTIFNSRTMEMVNSPYDEQSPVLHPDGKTLFFTIGNHPQNIDGKRDPGDIWYATWMGDRWSAPVHAGSLINTRGYNAIAGFSAEGSQMYLLSHYDDSGTPRTQGIAVSRRTSSGWSKPQNISIPYFHNKSSLQSGFLSADGRVFIYSAESYGTHGVEDIYVSLKSSDGTWGEPRNVGKPVNSQFQELTPSLSADGTTLYFSGNGRKGMGSFDVYYSTRLDDSYTNWSEPVNMGESFNTNERELFFRPLPDELFIFTSTKNSDGYGDIKVHSPDGPDAILLTYVSIDTITVIEEKKYVLTENELRIYGKVTNAKTGSAIPAKINFNRQDTLIASESKSTGYSIILSSVHTYNVDVQAEGYISTLEKLDLHTIELKELEMNFKLQPIEVGTTVNLKNVLFIQSKAELLPESYPELNLVIDFLKANPQVEIELAGHTDSRGSYRQLMELSQKRVNRVKEYMVSKGIDKKRITGRGYGGSVPVASNDTDEGRILNRRVEFTIKKL